jgi:microcystin-dependent protein
MTRVPVDFSSCWGQTIPTNQNMALYSLIGITFGGNATNFQLPDSRSRVMVAYGQGTSSSGPLHAYQLADKNGVETVTLTQTNLPAHTHNTPSGTITSNGGGTVSGTATGSVSGTAPVAVTVPVNSTAVGTATPASGTNYLGAVTAKDINNKPVTFVGPYSTSAPTGTPPSLTGTGTATLTSVPVSVPISIPVSVSVSGSVGAGTTSVAGQGQGFSILTPSLAMNFIIATAGLYPNFP